MLRSLMILLTKSYALPSFIPSVYGYPLKQPETTLHLLLLTVLWLAPLPDSFLPLKLLALKLVFSTTMAYR